MVHIDTHPDVSDSMFGKKITHGTPFGCSVEEGLLDGNRVAQIGVCQRLQPGRIRLAARAGVLHVSAAVCWHKSLVSLKADVCDKVGPGPVCISFDIDDPDPVIAPTLALALARLRLAAWLLCRSW